MLRRKLDGFGQQLRSAKWSAKWSAKSWKRTMYKKAAEGQEFPILLALDSTPIWHKPHSPGLSRNVLMGCVDQCRRSLFIDRSREPAKFQLVYCSLRRSPIHLKKHPLVGKSNAVIRPCWPVSHSLFLPSLPPLAAPGKKYHITGTRYGQSIGWLGSERQYPNPYHTNPATTTRGSLERRRNLPNSIPEHVLAFLTCSCSVQYNSCYGKILVTFFLTIKNGKQDLPPLTSTFLLWDLDHLLVSLQASSDNGV